MGSRAREGLGFEVPRTSPKTPNSTSRLRAIALYGPPASIYPAIPLVVEKLSKESGFILLCCGMSRSGGNSRADGVGRHIFRTLGLGFEVACPTGQFII